ncbi:MAG: hypothetical protein P4L96_12915 [Rhodoferax sp.]|nr:hypothetical protein [Rhodoferax sp.]
MAEIDQQPGKEAPQAADQEWLRNYLNDHAGQVEPGAQITPGTKKGPPFALLLGGVIMLAVLGGLLVAKSRPGAPQPKNTAGDLGQGVASDAGVRGHLVTSWQDKAAHYKLKIEPINFPEADGFARATAVNSQPLVFNVRVLNVVGDAICGKQVVLLPAAGGTLPAGADAFKRITGKSGGVEGLWAEGTLPCSADQYERFNYWDFTTNFPTVAEQDKMLGIAPRVRAEQEAPAANQTRQAQSAAARAASANQRAQKKPQSSFFLQGDDHATSFEPGRNLLTIGPGKSFVVLRAVDLQTAAAWADDEALVHYTCDQHAICSLRHSGSAAVVLARMNN